MEGSNQTHERTITKPKEPEELEGKSFKEIIEFVDKLTLQPNRRAEKIFRFLIKNYKDDLTNWDLVCFSTEVLVLMTAEFPWLKSNAIQLSQLIHKAHYIQHKTIMEHDISFKNHLLADEGENENVDINT